MSRIPFRGIKSMVQSQRQSLGEEPLVVDPKNHLLDLIVDRVDKQRDGLENRAELTGLQDDLQQLQKVFEDQVLEGSTPL